MTIIGLFPRKQKDINYKPHFIPKNIGNGDPSDHVINVLPSVSRDTRWPETLETLTTVFITHFVCVAAPAQSVNWLSSKNIEKIGCWGDPAVSPSLSQQPSDTNFYQFLPWHRPTPALFILIDNRIWNYLVSPAPTPSRNWSNCHQSLLGLISFINLFENPRSRCGRWAFLFS